ncbi:MAG: nucleotidyl transferase AbiEii/AbiGii toxin family protein [Deltaproteobacteria bacterium]|nr:nucleotidyl transferase AbiEii/AbiGii toxin family protein [Deltaproteobacteria bacterium]
MNILTKIQKQFLAYFGKSELSKHFYFTGGTALSYVYLQHRRSYDLDFFTDNKTALDINAILSFLHSIAEIKKINYEAIYDRRLFLISSPDESLKVEFTFYPFKNVAPRRKVGDLWVDSFEDIFVNKLAALADRNEVKDIMDIYFILKEKGRDYILWGFKKVREKFGIEGIEYVIQRKFTNLPEKIEDEPYLIKPIENYKELFEDVTKIIAKAYWNTE